MPERGEGDDGSGFTPQQLRVIRELSLQAATEFFRHEMANLGFGTLGTARDETLRNNWFLNEERKRFETPEAADDRKWVREIRPWWMTEEQMEIRRQLLEEHKRRKKWAEWRGSILTAVIGAVITAAMLFLFTHLPAIAKVIWP